MPECCSAVAGIRTLISEFGKVTLDSVKQVRPARSAPALVRAETAVKRQASEICKFSRSAIKPGPVGSHPSLLRVCALEAGTSCPANLASQPK